MKVTIIHDCQLEEARTKQIELVLNAMQVSIYFPLFSKIEDAFVFGEMLAISVHSLLFYIVFELLVYLFHPWISYTA